MEKELKDMTKAELISRLEAMNAAGTPAATNEVVVGLRSQVATLENQVAALTADLTRSAEYSQQQDHLIDEMKTMIQDLNGRAIIDTEVGQPGSVVVKHRDLTVRVLRPVSIRSVAHTIQQIANSPGLLDHLINIKSGAIQIHNA